MSLYYFAHFQRFNICMCFLTQKKSPKNLVGYVIGITFAPLYETESVSVSAIGV